ncbi:Homoserine O-succinyltransferase [Jeotgalicoccus aerolatus]|uniref:Homoserine O-acetyltransferase n=1 Tax=Jeotgalicoccus aerolatus TaxID=709510 RepID=A0A1G8X7L3_9STAP|nr:homoserine O-succinyltransferase [Jeotgalicoccus aerolatus]MBP1952392.1 homoserine O-succinyltransferase [Jeotgalicoccus aerolatus]NMA81795.1 homoserine O-succinyltransferase [Jeotgalicoccus aerolatus]CAD2072675.1 Homoserine O-succinyltransferase [Jeotgalicoccus aerolatus]SDJ86394.1 homoserine O-succinyltransferase [Jeotgalicoccus aerolatus]GGE03910.1 homoserine O-succinyltransferase [Jeotgalicoccus aerolatus]
MPIKIIEGLPVKTKLQQEQVYTIETSRAISQDIRPLKILILNLMPLKETTELQLLRLLGNSPLQIDIEFLHMSTHQSKNTPTSYLQKFYKTHEEVKDDYFDGMIVTGAPVEKFEFDQVGYINELRAITDWAATHVFSRFYICWGAQFALNHYYNIEKIALTEKLFGVFDYQNVKPEHPYIRGFDDIYQVPQSRHTRIDYTALNDIPDLEILTSNSQLGPDIITSKNQRDIYIFGHLEYDRETLKKEYDRDIESMQDVDIPVNYYPNDNPSENPKFQWRSHGHLLFNNWLNETYQNTLYDLTKLHELK